MAESGEKCGNIKAVQQKYGDRSGEREFDVNREDYHHSDIEYPSSGEEYKGTSDEEYSQSGEKYSCDGEEYKASSDDYKSSGDDGHYSDVEFGGTEDEYSGSGEDYTGSRDEYPPVLKDNNLPSVDIKPPGSATSGIPGSLHALRRSGDQWDQENRRHKRNCLSTTHQICPENWSQSQLDLQNETSRSSESLYPSTYNIHKPWAEINISRPPSSWPSGPRKRSAKWRSRSTGVSSSLPTSYEYKEGRIYQLLNVSEEIRRTYSKSPLYVKDTDVLQHLVNKERTQVELRRQRRITVCLFVVHVVLFLSFSSLLLCIATVSSNQKSLHEITANSCSSNGSLKERVKTSSKESICQGKCMNIDVTGVYYVWSTGCNLESTICKESANLPNGGIFEMVRQKRNVGFPWSYFGGILPLEKGDKLCSTMGIIKQFLLENKSVEC